MELRVPYPIPEPQRSKLMAAGRIAEAEFNNGNFGKGGGWQHAHARVEELLAEIKARYGVME